MKMRRAKSMWLLTSVYNIVRASLTLLRFYHGRAPSYAHRDHHRKQHPRRCRDLSERLRTHAQQPKSAGWAEQIGNNGATAAQLATVLANSPEGIARISILYQQVLGRSSTGISSSEIANAEAYLAKDTTNGLANLRTSMASSAEAQADIRAVYQDVLGRAASSSEMSTAESALANGATLADLYGSAAASPELKANLAAAYTSAFGTAPSAAVVTYLQQQIVSGAGFMQLTTALASLAGSSGGTGTIITPQITSAIQDAAGAGYRGHQRHRPAGRLHLSNCFVPGPKHHPALRRRHRGCQRQVERDQRTRFRRPSQELKSRMAPTP